MILDWTPEALSDLARLHAFLEPEAKAAAARVVVSLIQAADRLVQFPRAGQHLDGFDPREVRRLVAGNYEIRYEIRSQTVIILEIWSAREDR